MDRNADLHGVREAARAFVDFLRTTEAQRAFARRGFRPVDREVAREFASRYPPVEDLWPLLTLGGWRGVEETLYGSRGRFTLAYRELHPVR